MVRTHTVLDRCSELMWTQNAGVEPFPLTWHEALLLVSELNKQSLYGFSDWRLPNRRELFSLVSHDAINPALSDGHPFNNVFSGYYWSSTTCCRLPDQAWYVHLGGARLFKGMKHGSYLVWPVRTAGDHKSKVYRTGQDNCYTADGSIITCAGSRQDGDTLAGQPWPQPRFDVERQTVFDRLSGLVWDRTAQRSGAAMDWQEACAAVDTANLNELHGYHNWRLPTVRELESLCDMGTHSPALPRHHPFEQVQPYYWSATTSRYDSRYAWVLYLQDGAVGVGYKSLAEFYVWLVRDVEG